MPYGTARLRAFYGAGDYGRAMVAAQAGGMVPGYYAAGGFWGSLKKAVSRVDLGKLSRFGTKTLGAVTQVAGGLVPAPISSLATALSGYNPSAPPTAGIPSLPSPTILGGGLPPLSTMPGGPAPLAARGRAGGGGGGRRRRRRSYGHPHSCHHTSHRRRRHHRRRRRGGGRVSFTTKSGKRVSFTARRGDDE